MKKIEELKKIQEEEINNGFKNGSLYNEIEDLIWKIQNPNHSLDSEIGDMYGGRQLQK